MLCEIVGVMPHTSKTNAEIMLTCCYLRSLPGIIEHCEVVQVIFLPRHIAVEQYLKPFCVRKSESSRHKTKNA